MCARPERRTEGREIRAHWREFWVKLGSVPERLGGSPGASAGVGLAASCDAVQKQIDSAQAHGMSTASYESACKSGVTSFQSAGYCK